MDRNTLVAVALGEQPADLVITGGQLVNVFSGEIYPADLAVAGNRIAVVGDVSHCTGPTTRQVRAAGRYLVPGLIDCHIHVGASSLVMTEFARLVVPNGTAAIVTDFTEAGKLEHAAALRFFLDEAARTPLAVYLSPFYTTVLGIEGRSAMSLDAMREVLSWPECVELREWNVYVQRHPVEALRGLADTARQHGRLLCGHLLGQAGRSVQAAAAAGVLSDHEAGTVEEALERIRAGVAVQMRYSSAADDMQHLLRAVSQARCDPRLLMFCTDEEDIDDLARLGHIDHRVRTAIAMGVAPLDAIRMGSLNAATYLRKTRDLGSLTPGRIAFINLVDDLRDFRVGQVVFGPEVVAENGRYVGALARPEYPASFANTIRLDSRLTPGHFAVQVEAPDGPVGVNVIGVAPYVVTTDRRPVDLVVRAKQVSADPERDIAKIAVVDRHTGAGKTGKGFIQGLGLRRGAFGSSYHPGPLNIGVVGASDEDMALVANRIAELQGGFVAALDGRVIAEVPLPLLGFLSAEPAEDVVAGFVRVKRAIAERLGAQFPGVYTALAYVCMPGVLPHVRISANGLLQVELEPKALSIRPLSLLAEAP